MRFKKNAKIQFLFQFSIINCKMTELQFWESSGFLVIFSGPMEQSVVEVSDGSSRDLQRTRPELWSDCRRCTFVGLLTGEGLSLMRADYSHVLDNGAGVCIDLNCSVGIHNVLIILMMNCIVDVCQHVPLYFKVQHIHTYTL